MYRRSRSNSCHHPGGSGWSHSPDKGGRKIGREEYKFSRKPHEVRSRSPRRKFWREEIKNIRGWREENERRGRRTDRRSVERSSRDGGGSKSSSRCFERSEKKPESDTRLKYSHRKDLSSRADKKRRDSRHDKSRSEGSARRQEKSLLSARSGSLSSDRRGEKSLCAATATREELGKISSQVERSGLDRDLTNTSKKKLDKSKRDSPDNDELVLNISENDIFPELREDCNDNKKVEVEASTKRRSAQNDDDKLAKIGSISKKDIENNFSRRKSKLLVVTDELSPSNISVSESLTSSDTSSDSSSSSPLLDGKDCSLLELEMEVFTTRLKELEWEREQLGREREELQDQELCTRRNIAREVKRKEKLTAELCRLENENKENQG